MIRELLKRWKDFSSSETKPLMWLFLGPLLLLVTLIFTPMSPFLPVVTVIALPLSFSKGMKGFTTTLLFFLLYFGYEILLATDLELMTELGWGTSLLLGIAITFLSTEEVKQFYAKKREEQSQDHLEMRRTLHKVEERRAVEQRALVLKGDELLAKIVEYEGIIESMKGLVEATQIEIEKGEKQNYNLAEETLQQHRALIALKQDYQVKSETSERLSTDLSASEREAKSRLKELNAIRVEKFQAITLLKTMRKRKAVLAPTPKRENLVLQTLEADKGTIKKIYDQTLEEYQKLREMQKKLKGRIDKAEDEEELVRLDEQAKKIIERYKLKKEQLEKTKSELIHIEREIFKIKKGMQLEGASATS